MLLPIAAVVYLYRNTCLGEEYVSVEDTALRRWDYEKWNFYIISLWYLAFLYFFFQKWENLGHGGWRKQRELSFQGKDWKEADYPWKLMCFQDSIYL